MINKTGPGNLDYDNDMNAAATDQQNKAMYSAPLVVATGNPIVQPFNDWLHTHNLTIISGTPPAWNLRMGEATFLNSLNGLQYRKIAG